MSFIINHTVLGWCWWDLAALLVLAAVGFYSYKKLRTLKQKKQELTDRLAGEQAATAVEMTPEANV